MSTVRANFPAMLRESPPLIGALLGMLACVLVLAMRGAGWLEPLELSIYDRHLRTAAAEHPPDERIVLVGADDADLDRWGWPLPDGLLAQALENLVAAGATAIGVDLYRDAPRGEGAAALQQTLQAHPQIVAVTKIGSAGSTGIPPPAYLPPERIGFADVVLDRSDIVRRGLLFLDDGETVFTSFALRLALLYLQPRGIGIAPDPADPARLMLGGKTLPPFEADDGGYVDADAGGYQFLLDYAGGPAPFRQLTLSEVLENRIPPDAVANRIVMLGVAAQSVKDFFATPFNGDNDATVYGIALHGHAVSQLLRIADDSEKPLGTLTNGQEIAWLALWALLATVASLALHSPWRLGLAFCLGLAVIYGASQFAMSVRVWMPIAAPALAWSLACLLTIAYLSALERRQRSQLMQLFARHVSAEVAREIWDRHEEFLSGNGRPLPRNLQVTVLFSDIRGFTPISERMAPDALMNWLNEYIGAMADLVIAHGGMVDKFIGDAVMAVFGAPVPHHSRVEQATDADRAVRCALAMGETIARLNADWSKRNLPTIAVRIGINSGHVIAGSLGSRIRLEYTIIGDAVNIASRLESMDKDWPGLDAGEHCRVLVSDTTLTLLADRYETAGIGSVSLKGKEQPIGVHRILGEKAPATT